MKGTERQVKWAEDIRQSLVDVINTQVAESQEKAAEIAVKYKDNPRRQRTIENYAKRAEAMKDAGDRALYGLSLVDDASWFIDNRDRRNVDAIRHELSLAGYFAYDAEIPAESDDSEDIVDRKGKAMISSRGDREVGNIWDVIEGLYHILSDYAKDFDCYAIAQDLVYFEDGHMYVDWGREDFWEICNRYELVTHDWKAEDATA